MFDKDNPNIMNAYFSTAQATIISNSVNRMIYIPIKPNTTYTMQKINSAQFYLGYINELPAENIEVFGITNTTTNIDTNHKSITITTGANAKYLVSRIYQTSQDTTITLQQVLDSIQIEENPTATEYEPYIEPQTFNIPLGDIELCDIDTYEDKIYSSNGRFYLNKNIGKVVLNGSEATGFVRNTGTSNWYYVFINLTQNTPSDNGAYIISSHYKGNAIYNSNTNTGICATTTSKELRIRYGTEDTIANFKNWLSNNNVTVYYVLSTPTTTEITQENYPSLYNALKQIQDYLTAYKINKEFILGYSSPEIEY